MAWMMADAGHHVVGDDMAMPGMASPADLTRLQRARGRDNEVAFLQLMIRHHQRGIDMAAYAVRHTSTNAVHQTAVAMIDEQSQEIILMAHLLEQRASAQLPTHGFTGWAPRWLWQGGETSRGTVSPPSLGEVGCLKSLLARRGPGRATSRRM